MSRRVGPADTVEVDVAVVGAGNAALCAALTARQAGARVLVLEKAPFAERGGNSRFTGGLLRFAFDSREQVLDLVGELDGVRADELDVPAYPAEAYVADVHRLCGDRSDPALIDLLAHRSFDGVRWLAGRGVRFELYEKFVTQNGMRSWPDHAMVKVRGGGEGLVGALFAAADRAGVDIRYDAQVVGVDLDDEPGRIGLRLRTPGRAARVAAGSVVLASGGFEANPALRAGYLGHSWDLAKVRGTRHNTGEVLAALLAAGADPAGNFSGAHAVPVDAYAPDVGDLRLGAHTTRTSYPYGLMVNLHGRRFTDEGADFKLYTYARIGREVLAQPQSRAFQLFDQRTVELIEPRYATGSPPVLAGPIGELADATGVPRENLVRTVEAYNGSVNKAAFNPAVRDGLATGALDPPKSNWATRLDRPPFLAYAVTCGITFTYGGLGIDTEARVRSSAGTPIPGLYATGEIAGGFFYHNYPAGAGLLRGTVFGRIAGANAARYAGREAVVSG